MLIFNKKDMKRIINTVLILATLSSASFTLSSC